MSVRKGHDHKDTKAQSSQSFFTSEFTEGLKDTEILLLTYSQYLPCKKAGTVAAALLSNQLSL